MSSGIVAGSFDPVTKGHLWVIEAATAIFGIGRVKVVIAENATKKYHFSSQERKRLILTAAPFIHRDDVLILDTKEPLVRFAARHNVTHLVRGIRDIHDFTYETQVTNINRNIEPDVETLFLVPPRELTEVSSSMVRGLVGLDDWERIVSKYVPDVVIEALRERI